MQTQRKTELGKTGIQVSLLGLGCWAIGGPFLLDGKQDGWGEVNDEESILAIHEAIERDINYFDTSDVYGIGHSERLLGKALKEYRDKVVIATKFGFTYDEEKREITGQNISPEYIRKACEKSLKRLQTDYIDVYQIHLWSLPEEKVNIVIETLNQLQEEGTVRTYGWSTGDLKCAQYFAENSNGSSILHPVNVFGYNKEIVKLCEEQNLTSINSTPLAMGFLSGKFNENTKFTPDDVRGSGFDWISYFKEGKPAPEFLKKLESIKEILKSDGRTLVQGALAWNWAISEQNIPIPGFKTAAQVIDIAKAMEFGPLTQQEVESINLLINN
ncbi:aldo/keto reductase [Chengkuizengella sp. SCS-71B]|uniref:aldo/keto reductase n=1 Tax=Chengkuizengella sp. SCS-71B TaxID=3115290 RepID=UPI0032C21703